MEGGRQTKRNRQTASAVLATSYGPNFHPWFHRSRLLARSFARSCSTAHTHTHAPCSSASRIFKQVISPPSPLPTSPHPSITRPERTENGDLRSLPFDACQACLCLPPSQQTELQFVSNMCLRTNNGAQVLQVQNWFQESHAGRQCKGSRHRSSDFLQLKLNAHCAKMWKMKQLMHSRMRFAEGDIKQRTPACGTRAVFTVSG